jgi:hypothetical protein
MLVAVLALLLGSGLHALGRPGGVAAAQSAPPKIAPALQQRMLAAPTKLLPVIVEMEPPSWPFSAHPGLQRAQAGLDLLRQYGRPVGALPLIGGAAGWANAAGITALSVAPGVAYVHEDSTVRPRRPAPAAWPGI